MPKAGKEDEAGALPGGPKTDPVVFPNSPPTHTISIVGSKHVTDDVPPEAGTPNGELPLKSGADPDANGCAEDAFAKPPSIAHTPSMGFGHTIVRHLTLRCRGWSGLAETEKRLSTVAALPTCRTRNRKRRRQAAIRTSIGVIVCAHDAANQYGNDSVDRGTAIKGTAADVTSFYICEKSMLQQRWAEFSIEQLLKQLPSSFLSSVHIQHGSCPIRLANAVFSVQTAV